MADARSTKYQRRWITEQEWGLIVGIVRDGKDAPMFDDLWGRYRTFDEFCAHLDATFSDTPTEIKARLRRDCKCRGGYRGLAKLWDKSHAGRAQEE